MAEIAEVSLGSIRAAAARIQKVVPATPIKESKYLERVTGVRTFLKLENLNISGSFKIRGAANALLQASEKELSKGVVCASAGNHAQGVAHICRRLGAQANIFMPERTPLVKVESTRNLGGEVHLGGETYDDAYQAALKFHKERGGIFVHPFADRAVIAGQGSVGLEMLDQIPDLGLVIVPIGGGGLVGGIATAIKQSRPDITVVGVEAAEFPAMKNSLDAGKVVVTETRTSIADGIAVKRVDQQTFDLTKRFVDEVVLVDEDEIASAIMVLMERDHILAEGAGAVPAAALIQCAERWKGKLKGKNAACVISGGNIDVNLLNRIMVQGLVHSGRMMRLKVRIKDRPGSLSALLNLVGRAGANLIEVQHNRLFGTSHYDDVEVALDLETSSTVHQQKIKAALESEKFKVEITAG